MELFVQKAIAERNGLALENMLLSSGSNEALQVACVACGKNGKSLLNSLTYSTTSITLAAWGYELFIHFVHAFIERFQELVRVLLAEDERRPNLQNVMKLSGV